jgi:hypothetical protein
MCTGLGFPYKFSVVGLIKKIRRRLVRVLKLYGGFILTKEEVLSPQLFWDLSDGPLGEVFPFSFF